MVLHKSITEGACSMVDQRFDNMGGMWWVYFGCYVIIIGRTLDKQARQRNRHELKWYGPRRHGPIDGSYGPH